MTVLSLVDKKTRDISSDNSNIFGNFATDMIDVVFL